MSHLYAKMLGGLAVSALVLSSPLANAGSAGTADGTPLTLTYLTFGSSSMTAPGWTFGSGSGGAISLSSSTTQNLNGDAFSLEGSYPTASGGIYVDAAYSVAALNTEDLYIEFWAKMPGAKQGLKFLKVFGERTGSDQNTYANATFGLDYTGIDMGAMYMIGFGDGSGLANDVNNGIMFDGSDPQGIGRSYGTAVVQTPQKSRWASSNWGTSWHHFRVHVKFNSGTTSQNEVANGEFFVEIDGKVYVDATGLFNRNPADGPIDRVELFGWAQNDATPFQVWYDDVRISTGGFLGDSPPMPPGHIAVQ